MDKLINVFKLLQDYYWKSKEKYEKKVIYLIVRVSFDIF